MFWQGQWWPRVILGAAAGIFLGRPAQSAQSIRTVINPPEKTTLNLTGDAAGPPVLSSDGASIAFAATSADGKTMLWVRAMNLLEARVLPGTDGAVFPFWSPDSRSVGFFADGKLKTIDIDGGSIQIVADAPYGRGGAWGPGGVILFSPAPALSLMRVSAGGGTPTPITKLDPALHTSHRWPFFLPDGKHFLYLAVHHDPSKSANNALYYASLDGRENRPLFRSQSDAVYSSGFVLFGRGDQLLAQPFNPSTGTLSGVPQNVAKGVMNDASTWHMDASASNDGLLIFGSGASGNLQLVWMDRGSKEITTIADNLTELLGAILSPQGDRIALSIGGGQIDIWVLDLARGVRTRLTFGPISNMNPIWSSDGKWIAYIAVRSGHFDLCRKPSDGSGAEETLFTDDHQILSTDWSRDGKYLLYSRCSVDGHCEILGFAPGGRSQTVASRYLRAPTDAFLQTAAGSPISRTNPVLNEVYVMPFSGGQGKWQVSANGGTQPRWSKDGKELYYTDSTFNILAVPVKDTGSALQFGAAQKLAVNWSAPQVFYDISPDGKKILLDRVAQQVSQSVTVVTDFTAGLKK